MYTTRTTTRVFFFLAGSTAMRVCLRTSCSSLVCQRSTQSRCPERSRTKRTLCEQAWQKGSIHFWHYEYMMRNVWLLDRHTWRVWRQHTRLYIRMPIFCFVRHSSLCIPNEQHIWATGPCGVYRVVYDTCMSMLMCGDVNFLSSFEVLSAECICMSVYERICMCTWICVSDVCLLYITLVNIRYVHIGTIIHTHKHTHTRARALYIEWGVYIHRLSHQGFSCLRICNTRICNTRICNMRICNTRRIFMPAHM